MIYYNHATCEYLDEHDGDPNTKKYPDHMRDYFPTIERKAEEWQKAELAWITEEIEKKSDGHKKAKGSSMADLRKYRNAVRDYIDEGVIGEKPTRPE